LRGALSGCIPAKQICKKKLKEEILPIIRLITEVINIVITVISFPTPSISSCGADNMLNLNSVTLNSTLHAERICQQYTQLKE